MNEDDRDLEIYKQRCEDFRSLNAILWQVPVMLMTITGGLWFAIAKFDMSQYSRVGLLLFVVIINVIFMRVLYRLRQVMESLLERIHCFERIQHCRGFTIVRWFIGGMFLLICASILAIFYSERVFPDKTNSHLTISGSVIDGYKICAGRNCNCENATSLCVTIKE